ncbi:MAG: NAD(P)/FAD-dependent oxidoreductase [Bacteroidota bacterium]|nr:NAD(P)/FAD-dependent oxidoreductase [Bacteroidota bacterium]
MVDIIIIGAGASGIFSAISAHQKNPTARILILEKTTKSLAKVKISGGGRCNVTHACFDASQLILNYPRGQKELNSTFSQFSVVDTLHWFKSHGVPTHAEEDGRIFPKTNSSQSIIDSLLGELEKFQIEIKLQTKVVNIEKLADHFVIRTENNEFISKNIIVSMGGHPEMRHYQYLLNMGLNIIPPAPSLFTFNIPNSPFKGLEGISLENTQVKIINTQISYTGPLLITHWGLSGPVILKCSAWAARTLQEMNYEYEVNLNFIPQLTQEEALNLMLHYKTEQSKNLVYKAKCFTIPNRLWERLMQICDIVATTRWADISKKQIFQVIQILAVHKINCLGKTTYKEEFVTAGGVDLKEINMKTMECKKIPGLFFCGEVMNVDGITGGFNFQHAWSSAWIAGQHTKVSLQS